MFVPHRLLLLEVALRAATTSALQNGEILNYEPLSWLGPPLLALACIYT